jgi:hypothetical protein
MRVLVLLLCLTTLIARADDPTAEPTADPTVEPTADPTAEATTEPTGSAEPSGMASSCPNIVETALRLTQESCGELGLDQVCYGHLVLDAAPRTGVPEFRFVEAGDVVNAIDLQSLRLNAMDETRGVWGVVLMKVRADITQANSPAVTLLLFGDVDLDSSAEFIPVRAQEAMNVRAAPNTDAAVLEGLARDEIITANARTADGAWLRVRISTDQSVLGWINAEMVTTDGDLARLTVVDPAAPATDAAAFGPMRAFSFASGAQDAPCAEAPNSGILIQTPEGVAAVSIRLDEVVIRASGTTFVQSQPSNALTVNTIEGAAAVTANGETSVAVEGTQVQVPLDQNSVPLGAPTSPEAYDPATVSGLPTSALPRTVEVAAPNTTAAGQPISGTWQFIWGVTSATCADGTVVPLNSAGIAAPIRMEGGALLWNNNAYTAQGGAYVRSYTDDLGNLHQDTLTIAASDRINGQKTIDFAAIACSVTVPFTLQLVGN